MSTYACPRALVRAPLASSSKRGTTSGHSVSSHQASTATGAKARFGFRDSIKSSTCIDGRPQTSTSALPVGFEEILPRASLFLSDPSPGIVPAIVANTAVFITGIKVLLKGLTWPAVINAWFLGTCVMAAFGVGGYLLVCLYFVFGSAVTKIKMEQKQAEGIAEARGGRREIGSVWGSGIAGVLCALCALAGVPPGPELFRLGFVASFCSKLSDTTASEVGKAYGKTTYMSTPPFNSVKRGTEGAVSLEGTVAGIVASFFFAAVGIFTNQVDLTGALICTFAAFVATTGESWLGASIQGKQGYEWLNNDVVNGVQIIVASIIAVGVGGVIGA
mgnify:CR=1 FL=1